MTAIWSFPTRIRFGAGEVSQLGGEVKALGARRVLLVSDAGVERAGLLRPCEASLRALSIDTKTFTGVSPNPVEADVAQGVEAFREIDAELIVAIGGGSPIDCAKLIATRVSTARPFEELDDAVGGDRYIPSNVTPIIAIPTTAGTGSEVGRSGVITLVSTGRKTVIFSPALLPRVAILDPELSVGLPAATTAATGFDALTHCLEAYVAKGDHPMADGIALRGIELVRASLRRAVDTPSDVDARGDMLKAAMMGAVAFQKGLGACHSMAHPLSSEHGLHHGLANALCLPIVVRFNQEVAGDRYAAVARIFDVEPERLADALSVFRTRLGIRAGLSAAGIGTTHVRRLAELAMLDGCHSQNPRPCNLETFERLFADAL